MRFIDLYAGLGGFHKAMNDLGHECVWASEINDNLRNLYKKNFPGTPIEGDIFKVELDKIPFHNIICGGFPCQPFSKAGNRMGLNDLKNGNHFYRILDIIDSKGDKSANYIVLENVENILKHDNGNTFEVISEELKKRDYEIKTSILSPHEFGVPHYRRRLFIVAASKKVGGLKKFNFPIGKVKHNISIDNVIDKNIKPFKDENLNLNKKEKKVISFWAKFIENFPNKSKFPSFPIWSHEWGADYPYIDSTPYATLKKNLIGLKGTHGFDIPNNISKDSILLNYIPRYSQLKINRFPEWKIKFIKHNRDFYQDYKDFIDDFLNKNSYFYDFDFSNQKFEWNCKGEELTLNNKLIQFRPSGLRVKKSNWSPAITTVKSQNIFYPKIGRQLSLRETLKLQSLELDFLPDIHNGKFISNGGYKAIGNSVNVKVVKLIGEKLLIKNNG